MILAFANTAIRQAATQARDFTSYPTVRAYRAAFIIGEMHAVLGAGTAESAYDAVENVIKNCARERVRIDAVDRMQIEDAGLEGYDAGRYGRDAMSDASIAMHFD